MKAHLVHCGCDAVWIVEWTDADGKYQGAYSRRDTKDAERRAREAGWPG